MIKEILTPEIQITWLPWAVQYFFMIALAYATVWIAAGEVLMKKTPNKRLLHLCAVLIISAAIVAPISLLSDLHQPARAWHFYGQLRPSSWMWFGAFLLPLFNVLALGFAWLLLRDKFSEHRQGSGILSWCCKLLSCGTWSSLHLIKPAAIASLISAVTIALYTGMELMTVKARVLWSTYWLPPSLIFTALLAAAGTLLVLNILFNGQCDKTSKFLAKCCSWALRLFVLNAALWIVSGGDSATEAARLMQFSDTWQISALWVVGCVLMLIMLFLTAKSSCKYSYLAIGLLAIHLAWGIRWIVLIQSQIAPKYGAGTYFYKISWGGDGVLGILGTFGLWAAIIIFLSEVIRLQQPSENQGA